MVIQNFIARRGHPLQFLSDNGTNLRAAEKELRESLAAIQFDDLAQEFTSESTSWKFNPPASPHMGGSWERLVRSIKAVLYQIVTPDTKLTDEKLTNLFCEVESIINSRPLTYLSLDTATEEALTPNHFLLGSSSGAKPYGEFCERDTFARASWRHSQVLAEKFWKRWLQDYLPELTRRSRWYTRTTPIAVGNIVIVVDPNLPRHAWPKGEIVKTVIGRDGQVRSAFVRTSSGIYHRPATKLAVLDISNENHSCVGKDTVLSNDDLNTGGEDVANSPNGH